MRDIQIFSNEQFGQVRWVKYNNRDYAVANDVARALGYSSPKDAISRHCKGGVETSLPSKGGMQPMKVIPEGDIYRLIIKSQLPSADKFERWVFDEVLPSIRKNGSYEVTTRNTALQIESFKAEMATFINETFQQKIEEIEGKCSEYYRPSSAEKISIANYIKKRLGIEKANEEYELVKQRVLIKLGANKWEDVDIETLRNSLNIIDESIRIIKADRSSFQLTFFENVV